ncbi:MAG TPA: alpha/beta hydrolase, partial [Candidatus Limnocylindrales bacterium]
PDKAACTVFGPRAGAEVMTSDGIRLAGWYVPAASGVGPTGPTLLIVHGWKSSKSGALDFAPAFHQEYNLVLFDLRNNGQSTGTQTSMGLYERRDVTRMLDWVAAQKHPSWIGIVANSMGASAALGAAVDDQRVQALILDSVHADWATSVGNAMEEDFGVPGGVAGTALIGGVSLRVGGDVTEVDPVRLIPRLGERPVLLIQGTADQVDPPSEASERNFHAGLDAGVPIEIAYCEGARHGLSVRVCPTDWAAWAVSFLARVRAAG